MKTPQPAMLAALTAFALAGCSTMAHDDDMATAKGVDQPVVGKVIYYVCTGSETLPVKMSEGSAELMVGDANYVLTRVESETGARYEGGAAMFWAKGETAVLSVDGHGEWECKTKPVPPA